MVPPNKLQVESALMNSTHITSVMKIVVGPLPVHPSSSLSLAVKRLLNDAELNVCHVSVCAHVCVQGLQTTLTHLLFIVCLNSLTASLCKPVTIFLG